MPESAITNTRTAVTGGYRHPEVCGSIRKADVQAISAVPGCDQQHTRPRDTRNGLPVPIWELTCPVHEAWISAPTARRA